jgi:hypothetical protein
MRLQILELLHRLLTLVKILCSPRRSFAFRMLESENRELKVTLAKRETEIQQLNEYIRLVTKNPLLSETQPKEQKGKAVVPPARRSRAEIEKKYQERFRLRAESIRNRNLKKPQSEQQSGYPNDYLESEAVS